MPGVLKKVRIRFVAITSQNEGVIRKYINQTLLQHPSALQHAMVRPRGDENFNPRNDVRLATRDMVIKLVFKATKSLSARELVCQLMDVSCGGVCVSLPQDFLLAVGGEVTVHLAFIAPDLTIDGVILGLKGEQKKAALAGR